MAQSGQRARFGGERSQVQILPARWASSGSRQEGREVCQPEGRAPGQPLLPWPGDPGRQPPQGVANNHAGIAGRAPDGAPSRSAGASSNVPAVHRVRACLRWVPSRRRARSSGRGGTGRRASLRCSWAITRPVEVRLLSTAFSKPPCRNQADEAQVQLLASRSINRSPTGGVAQPGRAPASHAGSRGFKSRRLHPLSGVRDRAGKPAGRRSASRRSDPMPAPMV